MNLTGAVGFVLESHTEVSGLCQVSTSELALCTPYALRDAQSQSLSPSLTEGSCCPCWKLEGFSNLQCLGTPGIADGARDHSGSPPLMCLPLICTVQAGTADLLILCAATEGQGSSPSWGERSVLEMVVVRGQSRMIALGQLLQGIR